MSNDNEYLISSDEEFEESDQTSTSDINDQLKAMKKPRGRPPKKITDEPTVKRIKKGNKSFISELIHI